MTDDYFTEHIHIITKLKWKLFTKLVKKPQKGLGVWIDRESN
jgi:hypothetical protein